jgi:hypothetical protein|tara:strand:- start:1030 stop:1179 length:150 start_codon:yes stop_codon:yes gene_type:complete
MQLNYRVNLYSVSSRQHICYHSVKTLEEANELVITYGKIKNIKVEMEKI